MIIHRKWAMPSRWTFKIKPIAELLERYVLKGQTWVDPFCGRSEIAQIRNDLNPKNENAQHHMRALEFLKLDVVNDFSGVLFDPPYTLRQVKECYESVGDDFTAEDSRYAVRWTLERRAIDEKIKKGGKVISFGYSTTCMGKKLGYEIEEILIVPHGSGHYDTLVTVERKK